MRFQKNDIASRQLKKMTRRPKAARYKGKIKEKRIIITQITE